MTEIMTLEEEEWILAVTSIDTENVAVPPKPQR